MKILVLGASGMAGHTIALYFMGKGHDVTTFTTTPFKYCNRNIIGNAFDNSNFHKILIEHHYDAIINCVGILNKNAEDNPSTAIYLNSFLPHFIADSIKERQTKLIQMSTDCVFAGNTGPYFENTIPDGKSIYDRSKALGEINDSKNLTFRNSIIGPDINSSGIGLFNWFMQQNTKINGYSGALWTGVSTLVLAQAMEQGIEQNLIGLYNLVNNESISKYDLLRLFNKYFKNNTLQIEKNTQITIDKSLTNTRTDFDFLIPDYEKMIYEMKNWIKNHLELYGHYKILG